MTTNPFLPGDIVKHDRYPDIVMIDYIDYTTYCLYTFPSIRNMNLWHWSNFTLIKRPHSSEDPKDYLNILNL